MRIGRPANTALGVGSALAGGVDKFFDRYYQAKQFAANEQAAKANQEIAQGKLGIAKQNVGLRGQELGLNTQKEAGTNRRFDASQLHKLFTAFGGGQDTIGSNPEGYGQAYQALSTGGVTDDFIARNAAALAGAQKNQVTQAARKSGAQASAGAKARSEVERVEGDEAYHTSQLDAGQIQAMPPGMKVRRPIRKAGKPQDELAADSNRRLGEHSVRMVRAAALEGKPVTLEMAAEAVDFILKTNPKAKADFDAAPDKRAVADGIMRSLGVDPAQFDAAP